MTNMQWHFRQFLLCGKAQDVFHFDILIYISSWIFENGIAKMCLQFSQALKK